jgi:hypothetical protein
LLRIRIAGDLSRAQHEEYLGRSAYYLQRGEGHIVLLDLREAGHGVSADIRQQQAEWFEAHDALLRARILGNVFIIGSPFLRLLLRTFLYLRPLTTPYVVVSDPHEAVAWVAGRFEEVGLSDAAWRIREHYGATWDRPSRSAG